jgi:transposase
MTISKEDEQRIRRLHYAEHWKVGTICSQLDIHEDTVHRVLGILDRATAPRTPRPSKLDAYRDFLVETLKEYPTLTSTRLHDMLKPRGYEGAARTLRDYIRPLRPQSPREVYLRLEALIAEQAQVDWAHVGKVSVPGGERAIWLFVIVLSWSRALWGEFVFDLDVHSLLRSLSRAATYFEGCTRQWLFDNPKTVVLERYGDAARFHPRLLEFAGSYCVSVRVCGVRKANQKGRVERAIRYLRDRFLAGRTIRDIEQGNRELLEFLHEVANVRPHPTLPGRTVGDCLAEEKRRLLPLPKVPPQTNLVQPVDVDKTAFVRFDGNVYSIPPQYAHKTVTLVVDDKRVRMLEGQEEIANHPRCWGKRQRIELPAHRQALLEMKRGATEAKGQERLRAAIPGVDALFERWVDAGRSVGRQTLRVLTLLDSYGEDIVAAAVAEVLAGTTNDPAALEVICERKRRDAHRPVPIDIALGSHVPDRDVIPQPLEVYDVRRR